MPKPFYKFHETPRVVAIFFIIFQNQAGKKVFCEAPSGQGVFLAIFAPFNTLKPDLMPGNPRAFFVNNDVGSNKIGSFYFCDFGSFATDLNVHNKLLFQASRNRRLADQTFCQAGQHKLAWKPAER